MHSAGSYLGTVQEHAGGRERRAPAWPRCPAAGARAARPAPRRGATPTRRSPTPHTPAANGQSEPVGKKKLRSHRCRLYSSGSWQLDALCFVANPCAGQEMQQGAWLSQAASGAAREEAGRRSRRALSQVPAFLWWPTMPGRRVPETPATSTSAWQDRSLHSHGSNLARMHAEGWRACIQRSGASGTHACSSFSEAAGFLECTQSQPGYCSASHASTGCSRLEAA
jgi:hypothetical protein